LERRGRRLRRSAPLRSPQRERRLATTETADRITIGVADPDELAPASRQRAGSSTAPAAARRRRSITWPNGAVSAGTPTEARGRSHRSGRTAPISGVAGPCLLGTLANAMTTTASTPPIGKLSRPVDCVSRCLSLAS